MKRLYLASSISETGADIAMDIQKSTGKNPSGLKTVFITTAAEASITVDKSWLDENRSGLAKGGFNLFDYTITNKTAQDFQRDLSDCDVIHVNGGNNFYLLLQMKNTGFDQWIKEQVIEKEKIYIGSSSGAQVTGPNLETLRKPDSEIYERQLPDFNGLKLIDFIIFPHWGSEKFKDLYFNRRLKLAYKPKNKIILLNNWQYVKVVGDTYKIVDVRD